MNPGDTSRRPFSHPLFGSSLSNLLKVLWINGGVAPKYLPQLLTGLLSATARLPFSLVEKVSYSRKLRALSMKPPIFIIGHWRSGTTHLCNLMARSPVFGYVNPVATGMPHDLLILGKLLRPWLEKSIPSDRLIDKVPVDVNSPQEDEFGIANMIPTSFLHGLYFPGHFHDNFNKGVFMENCSSAEIARWQQALTTYLKKVYLSQGQRQLLIRNPVYSTRIPLLQKMWPGARFIHIYRNPYRVFPSMKNYFRKLFPALALQDYSKVNIDEVIFTTYSEMMDRLRKDLRSLDARVYVEIKYETLEERPLEQLQNIYQKLGLSGYQDAKPHFENYLNGIRGYKKNVYNQDPAEIKLIDDHWKKFIDYYGY